MYTILIAHRDTTFAEQLGSVLRNGGYRVIECPGPRPPAERCIRCAVGYCPLTEGADLMIYDPLAHPDIPMSLAGSPADEPDFGTLRGIRNLAPHVHAAAREPTALLRQIRGLLAQTPRSEPTALHPRTLVTSR